MAEPVLARRLGVPKVSVPWGKLSPCSATQPRHMVFAAPPSPGDSAFREVIALGNLDLVTMCLFAFCFIFLLTKYGYFLPSMGMERNEERI